ncbi:hypothetical protein CTA2_260 [Colletotrichum tanaceti]|uniref:Uncharacterized protein n=1 Tax=Colletotrichum tanaceti TaxID=1306861 RepID=A0A4U6XW30_9PEZI|nr:hypothetical protein CTA2_260 [Colletotrichum tanaceti]TKW60171.1 hypothetical protein CTA1_4720 [Colletotrichum tanaceti]
MATSASHFVTTCSALPAQPDPARLVLASFLTSAAQVLPLCSFSHVTCCGSDLKWVRELPSRSLCSPARPPTRLAMSKCPPLPRTNPRSRLPSLCTLAPLLVRIPPITRAHRPICHSSVPSSDPEFRMPLRLLSFPGLSPAHLPYHHLHLNLSLHLLNPHLSHYTEIPSSLTTLLTRRPCLHARFHFEERDLALLSFSSLPTSLLLLSHPSARQFGSAVGICSSRPHGTSLFSSVSLCRPFSPFSLSHRPPKFKMRVPSRKHANATTSIPIITIIPTTTITINITINTTTNAAASQKGSVYCYNQRRHTLAAQMSINCKERLELFLADVDLDICSNVQVDMIKRQKSRIDHNLGIIALVDQLFRGGDVSRTADT